MQESNQKEPVQSTKPFPQTLGREFLRQLIKEFVTLRAAAILPIVCMVVLLFPNEEYRNKDSGFFLDFIKAVRGVPGDPHIQGGINATVSRSFKNALEACQHYSKTYENSHPYTLLWEKSREKEVYPKIRVIAKQASWKAEKCIKEEGIVKLIGIEYTNHAIETQFKENNNFVQIATSRAYYRSALSFDERGRITERKVLSNEDKKESDFEYESFPHLCNVMKKIRNEREVECSERPKEYAFRSLERRSDNFNILQISSDPDRFEQKKEYEEAISLYIDEREKLHKELAEKGCGAISIEPDLEQDSGDIFQISIAFLCLKESGPSHVRLMHRVNESNF